YTSISWSAGGKLWVHGGQATTGMAKDLWCITTEVGSLWNEPTVTGNPLNRYAHSTVITAAGRLWVFGGYTPGGRANDLWYVDTEAGNPSWHEATVTGNLPATRYKHSAVISVEGVMWVFGGNAGRQENDLWSIGLEAAALAWLERSPSGTLPDGRVDHTAVITGAGRMWIFGGTSCVLSMDGCKLPIRSFLV
ncbi:Lztr1, partial [Symbiodinium sp. KB8]